MALDRQAAVDPLGKLPHQPEAKRSFPHVVRHGPAIVAYRQLQRLFVLRQGDADRAFAVVRECVLQRVGQEFGDDQAEDT